MVDSTTTTTTMPRSRRVGMASPPPGFNLQNVFLHDSPSPPLPPRSPLRPASRSISATSTSSTTNLVTRPATPPPLDIDDIVSIVEDAIPLPFQMRHRDYMAVSALDVDAHIDDMKALPLRPESPFICSSIDEPASSSSSLDQHPPITKRHHALHELLSSERAYASDLTLMRGVHIPLALGNSIIVSPFIL
jgi:dynamin-binding protein